jgi:hypothetical protein
MNSAMPNFSKNIAKNLMSQMTKWIGVNLLILTACQVSVPIAVAIIQPLPASAGDTLVTPTQAFALRCRDLEIPLPYSRGYIEWTSQKVGSPPHISPYFTMTVSINRRNTEGIFSELQANTSTLTAYSGKFSLVAKSNIATGVFQGISTTFSNAVNKKPQDFYDNAYC